MLREDLQNSLKEAMKNKDMKTVSAVRLIIAGQKEKDVEALEKIDKAVVHVHPVNLENKPK